MHVLVEKVVQVQRGLIWHRRLRAWLWIATVALGTIVVLGLIDYAVRFKDPGVRILATSSVLLATVWAAYRTWYKPSRTPLRRLDVARRLESHFPQLQDSLASAIEFLDQSEEDELAGSAQLRRLVIAKAQNTTESLPLAEVIDRKPFHRAATAFAVAAVVLVGCVAWNPQAAGIAFARLVAPLGSAQWPRQNHLEFREVPSKLAAGQTYEFELIDTAGQMPEDVRFEMIVKREGRREESSDAMVRTGDSMIARRENLQHSFGFRATGGDDDTMPWNWVDVVAPPSLEAMKITTHPPAYSGLPSLEAERHLEVLAGTGLEVEGTTKEPISAARIIPEGGKPIEAQIGPNASGEAGRRFHVAREAWVAAMSGAYRLELVDREGVAGSTGEGNLRVVEDPPPSVAWQQPSDDLFVLSQAVVPIEVIVKDNLAIESVTLAYTRTDRSESELAAHPTEPPISIFRGPSVARRLPPGATDKGETQVLRYEWSLAPLGLPVGAQITMQVEAADYRPGVGRTASPRHISIINADKLEERLAERITQIVKQLERGLATQQTARQDVQQLEIELRDVGALSKPGLGVLQTAEMNQRRVARMLVDAAEGVLPMADAILAEIAMNQVENSATRETVERVKAELQRLGDGPLNVADRELATARKSAGTTEEMAVVAQSLAGTSAAEADVIATLERLIGELSGKSDVRRLIRLLTELRADQLAHEKAARTEIGLETLPLDPKELTRAQRANLNKTAAGEESLAERYDKIERAIDTLAQELAHDSDPAAGTIADTVQLARELAIALDMRQTTDDLRSNRVGIALEREASIAANLQKVIDALRNEKERKPQQLVDKLRDAEERLAALQKEAAKLRDEVAATEKSPASNATKREQLADRQESLQREVEKLSRELERLQAKDASDSTKSAAKNLNSSAGKSSPKPGEKKSPSDSSQIKKAEQDLKQASDQLAHRRQQAEDDLALELVRRFQAELATMVERQQRVLRKTAEVDQHRVADEPLNEASSKALEGLAEEERQLAASAREHGELLSGLEAVRISLADAERRLLAAQKLLDEHKSGNATQSAEQVALARLEAMLAAFAQTASEATPKPNPPPGGAPQNNPQQNQRRPTFELLQAKMLRMLQSDLAERTAGFEKRLRGANAAERAQMQQEAADIATEQAQLVELVRSMLKRNNEAEQQR